MSRAELYKFSRFLVVGGVNTLFGYAVYLALLGLGGTYSLALAVTYILGTLFNYQTTGRFVFKHQSRSRLAIFILAYIGFYVVNLSAIYMLTTWSDLHEASAQFVMLAPMAILSFLCLRKVFDASE